MKKKVVWLVVSCWMVAALLLASCAPAVVKEEEKVAPPVKEEEVVVPKEVVVPEKEANMVKWTGKKLDGTVVEKMLEKPRYGGVYVIGHETDVTNWDPGVRGGQAAWQDMFYTDSLVTEDWTKGPVGTGDDPMTVGWETQYQFLVPWVAESWELPDDSTIIYHIRKGVHWALNPTSEASRLVGGRELTADDVVACFRYLYGPKTYLGLTYNDLSDAKNLENSIYVSPTDKWAVVFKTKPELSGTQFLYGGTKHGRLLAPEVLEKYAKPTLTDWKVQVGTGAWMLTDYVSSSALTFARNPNYFARDPFFPENQLPYPDGVKVLVIPDLSTRMAALRTGRVDNVYNLKAEDAKSLIKTNPELKYVSAMGGAPAIYPRCDKPELPYYDVRVRRALMMAINHQELKDMYYVGEAEVFTLPVVDLPQFPMYIPLEKMPESVRELYGYHPDKAKQLLAEAGYPNGFKTEVLLEQKDVDWVSLIKEYWAKIGVDLTLDVRDAAVVTSMQQKFSNKEMLARNFSGYYCMSMIGIWTLSRMNNSMISDPLTDKLFDEIQRTFYDPAQRIKLYDDPMSEVLPGAPKGLPNWITYANEQCWILTTPAPHVYHMWQPWLKSYEGAHYNCFGQEGYAKYVWIDQALKKAMGR